ncbi:DUF4352 domain-containing protein [uncultured Thomasclavelia sp.]|uniref:DUF4352 domain-containing protein n=1 Tax=uncultured Thomasclavelia sp. TaxID=3025759 RepID=UPI002600367B|nr:DUF4352 domain-containing protein [uncultured Thomasclavelia sp.]
MLIFFLVALILFIIAIVSFVLSLIKKKSKKKALILAICGLLCMIISFAMTPANPTTEKKGETVNTTENSTNESEQEETETTYKIGDIIGVTTSDGSYNLTITGVSETSDRNQFSDTQADRVIIIDYAYENIDVQDELYIFDSNFKAYDADNNSLETYPADVKSPDSIGAGRKTTGQMAFALNNGTNKIELEYFDNMFADSRDCLIVVEW